MSLSKRKENELIEAAKNARKRAYCPYSRYAIGAAVLTASGKVFSGANVENASYGLSNCGERTAIFTAVSRGEKELSAICVVGKSAKPCGACRQVMLEFSSKDTLLICVNLGDDGKAQIVTRSKMYSMLPGAFDPLEAGLLPVNPQNLLRRRKTGAKPRRKSRKS